MRADRLVAILLMLQRRGQVTAAEVAAELEISERTARRDLEALGMAGLPVYSQQGRNGGWKLLGGARTDLSGLTAAEARALFLVAGPQSSATPEVKAALRKLLRALPEPLRSDAEAASGALVIDPTGWGSRPKNRPAPPFLEALQNAVIDAEQVELGYVARDGTATTRTVHPLGLATKNGVWYLMASTDAGLRTFRIDRVSSVERTGRPVERPEGFDLQKAWHEVLDRADTYWAAARVRGTVRARSIALLHMVFGRRVTVGTEPVATKPPGALPGEAAYDFEVVGAHHVALAGELAGFGSAIEVHDPPDVREQLARIGTELVSLYGERA
ncbi:MAG TPA: WYL domain-containing protein [Acidimicrobiales bacterium]